MAVIAVAGIGAAAGAGTSAVAAVLTSVAAIGAAYVDQRYIYPALFGKDNPKTPNSIFGLDQMTGEEGAPGHRVWGRSAVVGGHCMFFENLETITRTTSTKKTGAGATFTKRTATVGVGWAHGRVAGVNSIVADQKRFWLRDFDQYFWVEYRCTIEPDGGATKLIVTPTTSEAADLHAGGFMFVNGDLVKIRNSPTAASNGYWRVAAVRGLGDTVCPNGCMELTPLEGQTPVSTDPGSPASPIEIRRIDAGAAGVMGGTTFPQDVSQARWNTVHINGTGQNGPYYVTIAINSSAVSPRLKPIEWAAVGSVVRLSGCLPSAANGRYLVSSSYGPNSLNPTTYQITAYPLDGQVFAAFGNLSTPGGATDASIIVREDDGGFIEPVAGQVHLFYHGNETDGPDEDLAAIYG